LDFIGLTGKTSQEVYQHDRKCVLNSDLFLAICDFPSTGLGMEIGFALENNKKTVLAFNRNSKVSRMLLGIPSGQVEQLKYENIEEIKTFLTEK
jgi:nucleoside 2-deoxyribosyltransferase